VKIISKFRDFYDGGLALGQDTSLTYVRETRTYTHEDPPEGLPEAPAPRHTNVCTSVRINERWTRACKLVAIKGEMPRLDRRVGADPEADAWFRRAGYRADSIQIGCILFCGKQYPFYTAPKAKPRLGSSWDYSVERVYSWDKGFDEFVQQSRGFDERHLGSYRENLEKITGVENVESNLFFRAPVVMWLGPQIIVNPCLTDYGFQRVIDPYAAFQEISMFLGGVLGQNMDPPSPMTDKEKVISHGFDPRYGFRKPPGKNKRNGQ
jgi:hypothetical protein